MGKLSSSMAIFQGYFDITKGYQAWKDFPVARVECPKANNLSGASWPHLPHFHSSCGSNWIYPRMQNMSLFDATCVFFGHPEKYELGKSNQLGRKRLLTTSYWRLLNKKTREIFFDAPTTWPSSAALCCSCILRFLSQDCGWTACVEK